MQRIFHPQGLLIAEAVAAGLFADLDAPSLAALASTFRSGRSTTGAVTTALGLGGEVAARWSSIRALADELGRAQAAAVAVDPVPDPSTAAVVHAWTSGLALPAALGRSGLQAGDLVRELRQVAELLDQFRPWNPEAPAAIDAVQRGIVTASFHPLGAGPPSVQASAGVMTPVDTS